MKQNGFSLGWEKISAKNFYSFAAMVCHYPLAVGLVVPDMKNLVCLKLQSVKLLNGVSVLHPYNAASLDFEGADYENTQLWFPPNPLSLK